MTQNDIAVIRLFEEDANNEELQLLNLNDGSGTGGLENVSFADYYKTKEKKCGFGKMKR